MEGPVPETGVMMKGVNRQYSAQDLQTLLNRLGLSYDFLYLPWDSKHNFNIGLCFVNFVDVASADRCIQAFTAMSTSQVDSKRVFRSISRSNVHGFGLNLAYFIVSTGVMAIDDEHAPLVFDRLGQPISLRWAVTEYVTMDLLLKARDLKDAATAAARSRNKSSGPGSANRYTRSAEATQVSNLAGAFPDLASRKLAADQVSLPRNAVGGVASCAWSGGFRQQPPVWQHPQSASSTEYLAGSMAATSDPYGHGFRGRLPQSEYCQAQSEYYQAQFHSSSSGHVTDRGHQVSEAPNQRYHGPSAKCSLIRIGDREIAVFEF
eukprot:TRINITY_DN5038_c1_g1_i1.p1 TRINITY_DN5038_c1_g1~~TRINITY_DN5038_c1_g1_i1.p1  ORF type:complete len:320 (+),score=42.66 TRINITY_DN5038_c1_g1_i1:51-1010(+)